MGEGYDRWFSPEPSGRNPLMTIPRSAEELRARIPLQHGADIVVLVTYQSITRLRARRARLQREEARRWTLWTAA
ncbi:MAG: hypothetical protein ACREQ9_17595 [Candidatus Binatia bacterium]